MEHHINTLLSSLFSIYLPIKDAGVKIVISIALSQLITSLMTKMYKSLSVVRNFIDRFWGENYVVVDVKNPAHQKIIDYLYSKYSKQISGCKFESEFGENKMIIDKLSNQHIVENYKYDGINNIIKIKIVDDDEKNETNNKNDSNSSNFSKRKNIIIYSKSSTNILECYIKNLIKGCNEKVSNDILIFKLTVTDGKNRNMRWKECCTKTSKNIKNTIVSENVNKYFYEDVKTFMSNEKYYAERGLPYKRGY
jgi:hypothetical protein